MSQTASARFPLPEHLTDPARYRPTPRLLPVIAPNATETHILKIVEPIKHRPDVLFKTIDSLMQYYHD